MKPLILIGGGGHCRSVIDVIEEEGIYKIIGITDHNEKIGGMISGYEIIAEDDELPQLIKKYKNCLVTVGQLKDPALKVKLFQFAAESGAQFPAVISPTAYVSKRAKIGEGTVIFHNSVVNSLAVIGENSIVNTGAVVEHDTTIGDHTHISPGSVINGHCRIGNRTLIGSGTVVIQQVSIGDDIVVGANSTVIRDLSEPGIYAGSPARKIN
jgi:sugar O-acyltransferase (sialic acid O-acetyltransferase NeuD family)